VFPYPVCCQGRCGIGLETVLFTLLAETFLSVAVTFSPGLAVPEASTTSLVLPPDGGLKGVGPDVPSPPERSHGFGGEPVECK